MKRILALAMSLLLVFALVACSAPAETGDPDPSPSQAADPSPDDNNDGEKRTLRVGMECAYAPYNWAQADDSNGAVPIVGGQKYAYGYDVMMAKYICEQLDWNLEIHQLDWDSLSIAVQSGTIDCAIAGQSITAERLQTIDFTEPYYYASIVVLTKKDSDYANAQGVSDLKGATVTSQISTVWYNVCLPQIEDANILPATETAPNMLLALDSGSVDLVVTDLPTAMGACAVYPDMVLLDFTETDDNFDVSAEEINIGVSVQKGNTELLDAINSVLVNLTEEDFNAMMDEAIAAQPLSQ